ncbi:MAG: hypothetical protein LBU56_01950 [Rickettsiales bacterium]|nr:hypothetical protein [Rickettsiales bacterium]
MKRAGAVTLSKWTKVLGLEMHQLPNVCPKCESRIDDWGTIAICSGGNSTANRKVKIFCKSS